MRGNVLVDAVNCFAPQDIRNANFATSGVAAGNWYNKIYESFCPSSCLNEEATLPLVLKSIPKKIKNVDSIEILVIDDGSTDETVKVAKKHGVTHFVHHTRTMGLARSFRDGVDYALKHGADIVCKHRRRQPIPPRAHCRFSTAHYRRYSRYCYRRSADRQNRPFLSL